MSDYQTPPNLEPSVRLSSEEFTARWKAIVERLRGYCRRKLGNPDEADEVVQQVAFNAWSGHQSLRDPSRFEAWVFVLAGNEINRMIGFNIRRRTRNVAIEDQEIADPKSTEQQAVTLKNEENWIHQVIDQMTEEDVLTTKAADVVRHHLRENEPSWEETGKYLGISANDCAATYCRAIPRVRQWILCHHPGVVGGTKALTRAMLKAQQARTESLSDFEAEVFRAKVLNRDTEYRKSGWRKALQAACNKVLQALQLNPGSGEWS